MRLERGVSSVITCQFLIRGRAHIVQMRRNWRSIDNSDRELQKERSKIFSSQNWVGKAFKQKLI